MSLKWNSQDVIRLSFKEGVWCKYDTDHLGIITILNKEPQFSEAQKQNKKNHWK